MFGNCMCYTVCCLLSHLPEAVTGDVDHGVIVGAGHGCCPRYPQSSGAETHSQQHHNTQQTGIYTDWLQGTGLSLQKSAIFIALKKKGFTFYPSWVFP